MAPIKILRDGYLNKTSNKSYYELNVETKVPIKISDAISNQNVNEY